MIGAVVSIVTSYPLLVAVLVAVVGLVIEYSGVVSGRAGASVAFIAGMFALGQFLGPSILSTVPSVPVPGWPL